MNANSCFRELVLMPFCFFTKFVASKYDHPCLNKKSRNKALTGLGLHQDQARPRLISRLGFELIFGLESALGSVSPSRAARGCELRFCYSCASMLVYGTIRQQCAIKKSNFYTNQIHKQEVKTVLNKIYEQNQALIMPINMHMIKLSP